MRSLRPCFSTGCRIRSVQCFAFESHLAKQTRLKTALAALRTSAFNSAPPLQINSSFQRPRRFEPWPLAAWKQEVEFVPAKIVSNTPVASQVRRLRVDIGDGARAYDKPGQFIQIRVEDSKPAFMAIASLPGDDPTVDLLIKCSGETSEQVCALPEGSSVDVSDVMGKGFPLEKLPVDEVSQVWMFTTGTGIAPIQTALLSPAFQLEKRESVQLYYGVKDAESSPVRQELQEWSNNYPNLKINVVYSSGEGYIQDVFEKTAPEIDPAKTGVLLCGQREMCERVTQLMTARGVDSNRILLNF